MSDTLFQRWLDNGDEQAAEALYQAHREHVYRLAYALLGDANDAEGVMQDTMVYALTRIALYDPQQASFSIWLHSIAVSRCRARKRQKHVTKAPLGGRMGNSGAAADRGSGPKEIAVVRESQHDLWQTLDRLSHELREAIILRYWGGHTYQEMAQILRCPLPTAQSRVRLAFEQLCGLLAPAGVPALGRESLR